MQQVSGWHERANAALELKRYDLALQLVVEGLAATPDSAQLLALGARIQYLRKSYWEACEFGREAIRKNPDNADAYYWLAVSMMELPADEGNRAELQSIVQHYLEIQPHNFLSHQLAGQLAWGEFGDWGEAERCYRRALEINPTDPLVLQALARLTRLLGQLDEAAKYLQTLQQLHPNYGWGVVEKGWLHLRLQQPEEALQCGLSARELLFQDNASFKLIAEAAIELRKYDLALQSIHDSLAIDPNDSKMLTLGAWLHVECKRYAKGCQFARQAIALDPDNLEARHTLACGLVGLREDKNVATEIEGAVMTGLLLGAEIPSDHKGVRKVSWDWQRNGFFEEHVQAQSEIQQDSNSSTANPEPLNAIASVTHGSCSRQRWMLMLEALTRDSPGYVPLILALSLIVYGQCVVVPLQMLVCMWLMGIATIPWFFAALLSAVQKSRKGLAYQFHASQTRFWGKISPVLPAGLLLIALWSLFTEHWTLLTALGLSGGIVALVRTQQRKWR